MTGMYVRVKRGDEWKSLEIEELTNEELDQFIKEHFFSHKWDRWFRTLVVWIRDHVENTGSEAPATTAPTQPKEA